MRVLLAEYTVFNDPALAPEGEAMLNMLTGSFDRCGYEVVTPEGKDFEQELARLAPDCELGLVIAPDHLLARYSMILEEHTHSIGCNSMSVAICANKRRSASVLSGHGISVPPEVARGPRVIKQILGCGTQHMRLSDSEPGDGELGQQYIEGEHLSVSLVGSRVVGEACLYFSGVPPLVLSLNRQFIEISDGEFHYLGGETPVDHPRYDEIVSVATRTAAVLGCHGYTGIDMVVGKEIYVVDVNPRITSSLVGIAAVMEEEIADILVKASRGVLPDEVHFTGHATFDKNGRITIQ